MKDARSTVVSDLLASAREVGGILLDVLGALDSGVRRSYDTLTSSRSLDSCRSLAAPSIKGSCDCHGACWLPAETAEVTSIVSCCGTATVCISVRNVGLTPRHVFVAATGADAALAIGAPSSVIVDPFATAELVAELTLPDGRSDAELVLWVRGCQDQVIRWTVRTAGGRAGLSSHQVSIEDGPRTQHRWHDHFAQPYSCQHANG